ncbi:amidase [Ectothiorhodospiraceae bacterium WFHF3C12]|nr:amidase [Ectothiorhodospiraceae bacterium WFHF3C12]
MKFDEYQKLDATALAELIQSGEVNAETVLELAITRAEAVNGRLNALIHPLYDLARRQIADGVSGPLAGVPMLVKDLFQEIGGAPHHMGNRALKAADNRGLQDATLVRRWKSAGLVPFGRTNTPELGAKGVTEPDAYGPCRNPWNTDHTPGGSSGGSAAMVAAGVVPVAGGNDGGGSIRIPASHCGLFGLKPGRGRTPWGPEITEAQHGIAMNHVLTRSVRDSALILDLTQGPETGSLFHIEPPARSYVEAARTAPGRLRIGFSTESPLGREVDPEAVKAVEEAVALLQDLGHEVEEARPRMDMQQMALDWLRVWFAQCAVAIDAIRELTGAGRSGFEADTLAMAAAGRAMPADQYALCVGRWQQYMIALDQFLGIYDFWLTPTTALPAPRVGAFKTPPGQERLLKAALALRAGKLAAKSGIIERTALESLAATPFTQLANVTGVPAMSVPLHWCANGLPLGVQFVAGHGDEGKLLSLAAQLEQAKPWFAKGLEAMPDGP